MKLPHLTPNLPPLFWTPLFGLLDDGIDFLCFLIKDKF